MAKIDVSKEMKFNTSRSGGSGGQNVNKVETAVEGRWNIVNSSLVSNEEKEIIVNKLNNRIVEETVLVVRSQEARTQLANKEIVIKKINELVTNALKVIKKRKPTAVPKSVIEKRKKDKKVTSEIKTSRQKVKYD